jgi:hypothetical protein
MGEVHVYHCAFSVQVKVLGITLLANTCQRVNNQNSYYIVQCMLASKIHWQNNYATLALSSSYSPKEPRPHKLYRTNSSRLKCLTGFLLGI